MADVLIRDVPDVVLAGVDAHAADSAVSAADLTAFADLAGDLGDPEVMGAAWQ